MKLNRNWAAPLGFVMREKQFDQWPPSAVAYFVAFSVFFTAYFAIGLYYPKYLYLGRDAEWSLWLSRAYSMWGRLSGGTAFNPMQGMVSTQPAVNPYLNPGAWIFLTDRFDAVTYIASYIVYFAAVFGTTFLLGRSLGFSVRTAFLGTVLLIIFLFPPFFYMFGFVGWIASAPFFAISLSLSNLMLIAFLKIGRSSLRQTAMFALTMFVALFAFLALAPFYNGGLLPAAAIVTLAIFLSSTIKEAAWKLGFGLLLIVIFLVMGFPTFFLGANANLSRGSAALSLDSLAVWFRQIDMARVAPLSIIYASFCNSGFACGTSDWGGPTAPVPAITGSYWVHVATLIGGVSLALRSERPLSRFAGAFICIWIFVWLCWTLILVGIAPPSPLPLQPMHFYFLAFPVVAFFTVYGLQVVLAPLLRSTAFSSSERNRDFLAAGLVSAGAIAAAFFAIIKAPPIRDTIMAVNHRPDSEFIGYLRRTIALRPGDLFRGSVATIIAAPHGTARPLLNLDPTEPLPSMGFMRFPPLIAETSSAHDFFDFWWNDLPTLSEYGQGVSRPLMFYMKEFFTAPTGVVEINYAIPKLINVPLLRALGVRFVLTDAIVDDEAAAERMVRPLKIGITLRLYELSNPNLATFSVSSLKLLPELKSFAELLRAEPNRLQQEAFIESGPMNGLVPAKNVQMTFESGGVHVTASSSGLSAIILPVQFSNCYRAVTSPGSSAQVSRANLIHTLVRFEQTLDLRLRWEFNFWGASRCRAMDAADLKAMGL